MNSNHIIREDFSNPESRRLYENDYDERPEFRALTDNCLQCGGCSFFAPLNSDYGICCNPDSTHQTETVFEHFTCVRHTNEGWGPHSFTKQKEFHCRCGGHSVFESIESIIVLLDRGDLGEELMAHLSDLRRFVAETKED